MTHALPFLYSLSCSTSWRGVFLLGSCIQLTPCLSWCAHALPRLHFKYIFSRLVLKKLPGIIYRFCGIFVHGCVSESTPYRPGLVTSWIESNVVTSFWSKNTCSRFHSFIPTPREGNVFLNSTSFSLHNFLNDNNKRPTINSTALLQEDLI